MDEFRKNEDHADPVVGLFERWYFAENEEVRMRHLQQFLESGDPMRAWVLRVLLEGVGKTAISKNRIQVLLLQRIQQWEWDMSQAFMGDWVDCLARLWPCKTQKNCGVLDWSEVEQRLQQGNKDDCERTFVSLLDELAESQRWILMQLFLKKTNWGLSRQGIFKCLSKVAKLGNEGEASWYFLKDHPHVIERLLEGHYELGDIPKGCYFSEMEPIEKLSFEEIRRLNPEDYTLFHSPDGLWVQWVVTEMERAIYDVEGNQLNFGFEDLLFSCSEPVRWVGVISDTDGDVGNPMVEKRLAAVKRGSSLRKPVHYPVTFHLIESMGELSGDFPEACERPQGEIIKSWDAVEVSDSSLFVRKNKSASLGPKWFRMKPQEKVLHGVLLYAMREPRSRNFVDLTVGLKNDSGKWIPLTKVPMSEVGILDVDRLEEWMKNHVDFKKGPITEFEKTMVVEIGFSGLRSAPRRKCGLELEHVTFKRIAWEKKAKEVDTLEVFVNNCEKP